MTFDPFPQWFGASGMFSDGETLFLMGTHGLLASSADGINWTFHDTGLATTATNLVTLGNSILIGFSDSEVVQRRESVLEETLDSGWIHSDGIVIAKGTLQMLKAKFPQGQSCRAAHPKKTGGAFGA